ncbi:glycosyltransferase family 4 protein [Kineothrix sp. MB12-C1]|uniref:glycosyltransferase family 4 protein n=1 Tax=Kineothrix sp. MB12-C1 TaxID=3070215 RepID=UPI0027D314FD|nr:glycosyltransferase family 4 protein [Kineothrix sp. MB12-C1]WMC91697.1 glycosyltransferase family 4 protein [Kineothrix sp. MB12-C1]
MKMKQAVRRILPDAAALKLKKAIGMRNSQKMLERKKQVQPYRQGYYQQGINLIGDVQAETGLGQSMRILAGMIEKSEIPFEIKQTNLHGNLEHNDNAWAHKLVENVKYDVNIIHWIPETWAADYNEADNSLFDYRYNIAYWLWELEDFPDRWLPGIQTVDEIWTPSEFISNSIRKKTDKPVITIPYAIEVKKEGYLDRKYFSLPEDKLLFLTMYDFISISERKNPEAVIDAYMKAFPVGDFHVENDTVGIVIKVNHAEEKKLVELKDKLKNYKNVYFITKNLTRLEVDSLLNMCDILVSLHRSEGFGLPLAEAMALGKPVIATNWSASIEFMNEENACLVDYKLIKLKKTIGPYEKGNYWADADTSHAAYYMKKLWEDKEYRELIGKDAENHVKEHLTYTCSADRMKNRLKEIYEANSIC